MKSSISAAITLLVLCGPWEGPVLRLVPEPQIKGRKLWQETALSLSPEGDSFCVVNSDERLAARRKAPPQVGAKT